MASVMNLTDDDLTERFRTLELERRRAAAEMAALVREGERRAIHTVDGHRTIRHWVRAQINCPMPEANRLRRLAIACDCAPDAVHRIFRFVWRDGRLPDLPIEWHELTHDLGLPDADARIATMDVKDALRRNTDEALARGVFGVPTLAIGDALFWGADATEMARDYAAAGGRYDDPEYARVATLPEGATRRKARPEPARKPRTRVVGTVR